MKKRELFHFDDPEIEEVFWTEMTALKLQGSKVPDRLIAQAKVFEIWMDGFEAIASVVVERVDFGDTASAFEGVAAILRAIFQSLRPSPDAEPLSEALDEFLKRNFEDEVGEELLFSLPTVLINGIPFTMTEKLGRRVVIGQDAPLRPG